MYQYPPRSRSIRGRYHLSQPFGTGGYKGKCVPQASGELAMNTARRIVFTSRPLQTK